VTSLVLARSGLGIALFGIRGEWVYLVDGFPGPWCGVYVLGEKQGGAENMEVALS
jgi:hypothetical protein